MSAEKNAYLQSTKQLKKQLSLTGMIEYRREYFEKTNKPRVDSELSTVAGGDIERHLRVENTLPLCYGRYTPGKGVDDEDYEEDYYSTPTKLRLANGSRKIERSNSRNAQPSVVKSSDETNENIYLVMTPAIEERKVPKSTIENHTLGTGNPEEIYDSPRRSIPPARRTCTVTTNVAYDIPQSRKVFPNRPVQKGSRVPVMPEEVYDSPVPFRPKYRPLQTKDKRPTLLALSKSNSDLMKTGNSQSTISTTATIVKESVKKPTSITAEPTVDSPQNEALPKRSLSYLLTTEKNPDEIQQMKAEKHEQGTSLTVTNSDQIRSPDYSYVFTHTEGGKKVKGTVTISEQRSLKKNENA